MLMDDNPQTLDRLDNIVPTTLIINQQRFWTLLTASYNNLNLFLSNEARHWWLIFYAAVRHRIYVSQMGKAATTPARLQYHFANFKGYFCMVCSLRLRHHAFGARHVLHPSSSQFCFQCSCSARQNQRLSFLIYATQCLTKLKGLVLFQSPTNAVIGSSNAVALQCRQLTAGGSKLGLTQYTAASRTATKLIY